MAQLGMPLPRLQVDPSGHFLQTEGGAPFFWLADTAWLVMHRATREEAGHYLTTRARQGFNVIQVSLLSEVDGLRTANAMGERPFIEGDPLRPNPAYFDRVADFICEAAALGLYVAMVACWGDKLTAPWGVGPRIFSTDQLPVARTYGQWLGDRFAGHKNLIWLMGGDRPPRLGGHPNNWCESDGVRAGFEPDHDWTPIWREMAGGLLEATGNQALISYHPQGGQATTSYYLHDEPWLMIHSMQSGHGGGHDVPVWEWIAHDRSLNPPKPTFDSEPNYEDHPVNPWPKWDPAAGYFRDFDVRKQCWRSVFAGGCGVTYGHHAVWQWCCDRYEIINHADRDWRDALMRPAANQMRHMRNLIENRPFYSRIADQQLVLSGEEQGGRHVRATRDRTGRWAAVYIPCSHQAVVLDLPRLGNRTLHAWWYDPRNGQAFRIGDFPTTAAVTFTSPAQGPDWVLVLDDTKAGFQPPGWTTRTADEPEDG